MRLLFNQTKAGRLIDAAGGDQHVVRPRRDLVIGGSPGEANAFADKTAPDPERACLRLYVKEPQSKIGPLLSPRGKWRDDSFFFDQSEYAALPFGWYPVAIRVHENSGNQYDFLVISFMLLSDGRLDDR